MPSRPISEGLFTWPVPASPARPLLYGTRCAACGAVTLPADAGRLRVEGRLYDVDLKDLRFGMEFEVVVRPFRVAEDGTVVYTFGFAPSPGDGRW